MAREYTPSPDDIPQAGDATRDVERRGGVTMLDKRDIQNLMYCVRVTETSGQWQSGYPVRTPNDLEIKLAQLLRELDSRRPVARAA
jgi:hypothetical protein